MLSIGETRDYVLNKDKAMKRKLKDSELIVEEKDDGKCLVAQMNMNVFEALSIAMRDFYNSPEPIRDTTGTIVEYKMDVCDTRYRNVKIHLYVTKNKLIVQGRKTSIDWWKSNHLTKILENVAIIDKKTREIEMTASTPSAVSRYRLQPPTPPTIQRKISVLAISASSERDDHSPSPDIGKE